MKLHIIYTESKIFLSKKDYATWQDIQRDFPDYKASLGPWPDNEVAEYLDDEYSASILPNGHVQVSEFLNLDGLLAEVRFSA